MIRVIPERLNRVVSFFTMWLIYLGCGGVRNIDMHVPWSYYQNETNNENI